MSRRTLIYSIGAIVVLALVVRLFAAVHYRHLELQTDALDYDRHAVSIADGHGFPRATELTGGSGPSAWRPPLYPYVLGGVYAVVGTDDVETRQFAGRVLQALLGTGVVALIALIALQALGRRESVVASGIAAVYPPLVFAGTSLLTEPLFMVLVLGGIAAVLRFRQQGGYQWILLAGILAGLATLDRTNGVAAIITFALGAWTVRPLFSRQALRAPLAVIAGAILATSPWTIRNAIEFDDFVPVSTQSGFALAGQYNEIADEDRATWLPAFEVPRYQDLFLSEPPPGEIRLSDDLKHEAIDYAADHPEHVLEAGLWNGLRFFNLDHPIETERETALFASQPQGLAELSVYSFWLLGFLVIAGTALGPTRRLPAFMWAFPVLLLLSVMFVVAFTRYRVPADPIFILAAAATLTYVWDRFRSARGEDQSAP